MKTVIGVISASCMMLSFISCKQPSAGYELSQADRESLVKTHNDITASAHENPQGIDWDSFVNAHYSEDAILMASNSPAAEGHAAIIAMFKSWPSLTKFTTRDIEIEGCGNLAFIRGTYDIAMKMNDTVEVNENGKYIEVWKKNDKGEWKCIRDIFNSDMPIGQ